MLSGLEGGDGSGTTRTRRRRRCTTTNAAVAAASTTASATAMPATAPACVDSHCTAALTDPPDEGCGGKKGWVRLLVM